MYSTNVLQQLAQEHLDKKKKIVGLYVYLYK